MKEIPLTRGKVALVDDDDYEWLSNWDWYASASSHNGFAAVRSQNIKKWTQRPVYMHREIMGATGKTQVDHINGDTLDNRRSNLRCCSNIENNRNKGPYITNTSGYKGVCPSRSKWRAGITVNGKYRHIGVFDTPEEAARAYDSHAIKLFGEFARLNFREVTQ